MHTPHGAIGLIGVRVSSSSSNSPGHQTAIALKSDLFMFGRSQTALPMESRSAQREPVGVLGSILEPRKA